MQISEAEWAVMNLVWSSHPIDASEVVKRIAVHHEWSASTVKTMLHRLVRKGALSAEPNGKKFLYKPAVRKAACVHDESRSFLDRVFGGNATPALIYFVKNAKLSSNDVSEIKEMLDQKINSGKGH